MSNTTTAKITGIPTGNTYTQSYTLPSYYAVNKVNNSQASKPYMGRKTQTLGYSYTMPISTTVIK